MYADFFGLKETPFGITPDTSFFYANPSHQEALNTLLIALQLGEGVIKISGEVGTGKTLICRKLLNELSAFDNYVTAYIPNPALTASALRFALATELGLLVHRNMGQHQMMQMLNDYLLTQKSEGRQVVLIIDEAQALPVECLETVRLLTNLETEKSKLLQLVLFGQPELDERLAQKNMRQLLQRISFSYQLSAMKAEVIAAYLAHRLQIAGYQDPVLFSLPLAKKLYQASNGVPRLLNILAHKTLLAAYGEGKAVLNNKHVQRAIDDTESIVAINKWQLFTARWLHAMTASIVTLSLVWMVDAG